MESKDINHAPDTKITIEPHIEYRIVIPFPIYVFTFLAFIYLLYISVNFYTN